MTLPPGSLQIAMFVLVALSVGGIIVAAVFPMIAGASKSQKRIQAIASRNVAERSTVFDEGRRRRSVEETLKELDEAQKAKARKSKNPSLMTRVRQAGLGWSKQTYYLVCFLTGVGCFGAALVVLGFGLVPAAGFAVSGGILLPHFFVNFTRKRRHRKFTNEFPNAVDVIVRGVKAGLPLIDCLRVIAAEAQEPVRSEFREIVEDQTLGMPLSEAVNRLPERIPLPEANFFAIVIAIQSRSGGSLSEALGNLSKVLRDRKKMGAKIRAMSAEAKASAGIIGALPVIVTALIYLTSPDYIELLFTTTQGNIVLACSALWMFLGVMVMRKMINFDF